MTPRGRLAVKRLSWVVAVDTTGLTLGHCAATGETWWAILLGAAMLAMIVVYPGEW